MDCAICNKFQGKWKIDSRTEASQHRGQGVRSLVVPKVTWGKILISTKSCYGCSILVNGCRGCFKLHGLRESNILHASLHFFYPSHTEDIDDAAAEKRLIFILVDGGRFEVELFATEGDDCPVPDSWDYMPISKRTSPRTDSAMAITIIKGWISGCIVDHCAPDSFCDTPEYPDLPTRVVNVGLDDGIVRLVETKGKKAKYICLSHCWGLEQIITTTKSTFEERKKYIVWEELSKTFRDAITLTRTLGFNYIWIDSLCIIQDDGSDWEIESAKMASVYSNGHLTIAATHSSNGQGGLFTHTKDFRVSGKTPDEEDFCLYFRERIDHHIDAGLESAELTSTEKYYPLLSRAWVYQERMLSTRILHFGRYEMFFECKSDIRCECTSIRFHNGNSETPIPLIKIEYADVLASYDLSQEGQNHASIHYQGASTWRTMVCCYTVLSLTKSKDRLPAIGGLARQMAAARKSRYLAGLWEESLQDDLLWIVPASSRLKRPRPYPLNAPTWSWASVETVVDYWDTIMFSGVGESVANVRNPYEHFSVIEICEVQESAVDEFGSIAYGSLTISGLVAEGELERELESHNGEDRIVHYVSFLDTRFRMDSDYLLDHNNLGHTEPGSPVFCLRMSLLQEGLKDYLISLVLKRSSNCLDTFERIGTLRISGNVNSIDPKGGVFRTTEPRTIVII
jgi:hypothetical protein